MGAVADDPAGAAPVALPHPRLRRVARALHGIVARSPAATKAYLSVVGAVLRTTPDFPLKGPLINNLASVDWPEVNLGARSVQVCPSETIRLVPHPREFDFAALVKTRLDYETAVFAALAGLIGHFDGVIEIGANVGVFSVFMSGAHRPEGRRVPVYAFEPSRTAYQRLLENIRLNDATSVIPFNAAVAAQPGFTDFFEPEGHLTNGSLLKDFAGIFTANVARTIVPTVGCAEIEMLAARHERLLVKIDVEGAEALVLTGLRPFIERARPALVIEVLSLHEAELNALRFLADTYQFFLITDRGLERRDRFVAHPGYRDYLLLSAEDAALARNAFAA